MARQRTHAEVVFANLEATQSIEEMKRKENQICSITTLIYNGVGLVLIMTTAIVMQILFIEEDDPT